MSDQIKVDRTEFRDQQLDCIEFLTGEREGERGDSLTLFGCYQLTRSGCF